MQAMKQALNFASKVAYEHNLLSSLQEVAIAGVSRLRQSCGLKSQMACNVCSIVAGAHAKWRAHSCS